MSKTERLFSGDHHLLLSDLQAGYHCFIENVLEQKHLNNMRKVPNVIQVLKNNILKIYQKSSYFCLS